MNESPPRSPAAATALSDRDAEARLLCRLRERSAQDGAPSLSLVKADAAVLTGLPTDRAEAALRGLLREYRSHLLVTEQGELVYQFAPGLPRRDTAPLSERLLSLMRPVADALWRGFTVAFKIWIAATLVLYAVLFAVLGIALSLAGDSDDGPGGLLLWWLIPDLGPRRLGGYEDPGDRAPRKRFYRSVFDFVFGPPPGPAQRALPPLDDRLLLGYIRDRKGRVTASDLVLLCGCSYTRAEEEATRLMAHYEGEPEVSESGAIVYTFRDLRRTVDPGQGRQLLPAPPYAWERAEIGPPLTGNGGGTNAIITLLNGFNLVCAATLGPWFALALGLQPLWAALLTTVPLCFSLLFFAVPGGRYLAERSRRRARTRRNLRRALLWAIAAEEGRPQAPDALARMAVRRALEEEALFAQGPDLDTRFDTRLDSRFGRRFDSRSGRRFDSRSGQRAQALLPAALRELEALLQELDGDVLPSPSEPGAVCYAFPRLREERLALEEAQRQAGDEERLIGEVVFSSASEGAGV